MNEKKTRRFTRTQLVLFFVIGSLFALFFGYKFTLWLQPGDGAYLVRSYRTLDFSLSRSENIYLPDPSVLPQGDSSSYDVVTYSTSKLTPQKDGYLIWIKDDAYHYRLFCDSQARETEPVTAVRADHILDGVDLELNADSKSVSVQFLFNGYYYHLMTSCNHGDTISDPKESLDTLLNITDNILQQAG